ncbi:MAG: S8 family serine peptidase [Bacteroidetes bacterium]|nr:S8 family serine peptidase [Bacteroidota bacterium]
MNPSFVPSNPIHRRPLRIPALAIGLVAALLGALVPGRPLSAQGNPSHSIIVRLAPGITPKSAREALATVVPGGSIPSVRTVVPASNTRAPLAAAGLDRYVVLQTSGASTTAWLAALRGSPLVESAFENHRYHIDAAPNDSLYAEQWALAKVEAEGAWNLTTGDSTIIIGVVDTGIDQDQPDLQGAVAINRAEDINGNGRFDPWPSTERRNGVSGDLDGIDQDGNGFVDDVAGYDFVDQTVRNAGDWSERDPVPDDELGHGTNVAGVIAARRNNRIGIAGLAPGCRLLPLRAFDAGGDAEDDDIAAAIVYGVERGVRVLNLSFGDYYASPLLHDAIRYAYQRGVVVVAASGNEGGIDPHYPASFPEVIAVGASDRNDYLAPFTSYGSQLSLTAPGNDIITTARNGAYRSVSGTSFSTPYVAAAAALLLSRHPGWRPDEIRAALELSADDRGRSGWDIEFGAGRLNVRRAVEFPGPPEVAIQSPGGDAGINGTDMVAVIGSAFSPILESWQVFIGAGDDPKNWTALAPPATQGVVRDTLARFSAAGYASGVYTLRLAVRQADGHATERRVRMMLNAARPVIASYAVRNVWRFEQRAIAITVTTEQPSLLRAWLRPAGVAGAQYLPVANEAELSGWEENHVLFLTNEEMERGRPYDAYIELSSRAGDTTLIGSPAGPLSILREADAFPLTTLAARDYTLPYGFMVNRAPQLFGDGRPCVAMNRFVDGSYGPVVIYSFNGKAFVQRDSLAAQWIPRSFGDVDGNGLHQLLLQAGGAGALYSQTAPGSNLLGHPMLVDTTSGDFWADCLHDLDGDGRDEVLARTDNGDADPAYYYVARVRGDTLVRTATLTNNTPPAAGDSRNKYGPPEAAVADFDGDGVPDILIGDDDADFTIYKRNGDGSYRTMWTDVNDGEGGSEFVAAADLDGDGRAEAIVAYHARTGLDAAHTYAPPLWTVKAFRFDNSGNATMIWRDSIAYVRPTLPFLLFSGVAAGNLDTRPGDEVVLAFYPNLYVLTWDAALGTMRPLWYTEGVIANRPLIADIDGDGVPELGIGDGSLTHFYQINSTYRGPAAPAGFQGWAENDSTVFLEWNASAGTEFYTLYRGVRDGASGVIHFDSVARTSGTSIRDTGFVALSGARLEREKFYYYIVTARNTALDPNDSLLSSAVLVFTHAPPHVVHVEAMSDAALRVVMSAPMKSMLYRPGAFVVRSVPDGAERDVATVVAADANSFIVTLGRPASGDTLAVHASWMLRDLFDTPADSFTASGVRMPESELPGERFIATRALLIGRDTIAIDFNAPVDPATAGTIGNYVMAPGGTFTSAAADPAHPDRVLLALRGDYPVGAFGRLYTITVTNVRSIDGRLINDGAGSIVGLNITAASLDHVMAYPQPYSLLKDGSVTFAGLTRIARVRIFTQSGKLIRMLDETEGNGGVAWDGMGDAGEKVVPGVYLYIVEGTASDGSSFTSEPQKVAVVP